MKIKLKKWRLFGYWSWNIPNQDSCSICMNEFELPCPKCKFPGDECPTVEGTCSHHFHLHCMYKWLESRGECPLCRRPWAEKHFEGDVQQPQPGPGSGFTQLSGLQNPFSFSQQMSFGPAQ